MQLPPLPVISGPALAPSHFLTRAFEQESVALWIEGWVLSPVPPPVYLPLPAGLLGEQEMGRRGERFQNRGIGTVQIKP